MIEKFHSLPVRFLYLVEIEESHSFLEIVPKDDLKFDGLSTSFFQRMENENVRPFFVVRIALVVRVAYFLSTVYKSDVFVPSAFFEFPYL